MRHYPRVYEDSIMLASGPIIFIIYVRCSEQVIFSPLTANASIRSKRNNASFGSENDNKQG